MSRQKCFSYFVLLFGVVTSIGLGISCANRGYPEGGPKDTTPPQVVAEQPESYSRNFDKKRIDVYFDEFVQLKDVNEKFIISPPQKKKPKVRLRGKYIQVDFQDTLRPNVTYSLDFADAIQDYNEGNPLGFYRYVFSTGNQIDTLELSGNVVNAESGESVMNAYVMLYENHADSVPLLSLPDYIARTDSAGFFRVTNLRDTSYRVLAVEDNNRDYKFTPEAEMVAFLDSVVHPVVMPLVRTDTFKIIEKIIGHDTLTWDSIFTGEYLAYGPNNLRLRLFQENVTQLYLANDVRKERERLDFAFNIPAENNFQVELWDTLQAEPFPEDWYIREQSIGKDTITLWIKDSTVYKRDTLNLILTYLRTDTTGQRSLYSDTSRYTFKDKKKPEHKGNKKDEAKAPKIEFLPINLNVSGDLDLNGRLMVSFERPVRKETLEHLRLEVKEDTVYHPVEFQIQEDSIKMRNFYVDASWKPETEYRLVADSATIYDIYGRFNDKLGKTFRVRSAEYYGKIILNVKGIKMPVVLQLYKSENSKSDNGKRQYTVVQQQKVREDGEVTFEFLQEGKYKFRAILDRNDNGKWDTGLYLKGIQPEEIIYLPAEIQVKQNFDIEQEFDLDKTYKE